MKISSMFASILSGLDGSIIGIVCAILSAFVPQLANVSEATLVTIGNNFRAFLQASGSGTPVGEALASMMTADWNDVSDAEKTIALDFSTTVAGALQAAGILPASP